MTSLKYEWYKPSNPKASLEDLLLSAKYDLKVVNKTSKVTDLLDEACVEVDKKNNPEKAQKLKDALGQRRKGGKDLIKEFELALQNAAADKNEPSVVNAVALGNLASTIVTSDMFEAIGAAEDRGIDVHQGKYSVYDDL